ncbi:DUF1850 domain-containing protein [Sporosarcina sp. YIM B06819]|uniref:DUF1850 domain-containing protein n=1 Tax=Sporosarcina sp. YIM B06819 TaxID=3081769 RepID=UPI00298C9B09|nr:DUF1850 domain-containing protein [Sporosarcina sp. YIM B06819]
MKYNVIIPLILFVFVVLFLLPIKQAFTFTEHRTENPKLFYIPVESDDSFQIRYVHSIHLTDVIESYEITADQKIRLVSMQYEDLAIGLPGYAEEGETFSVNDGVYTLTYDDNVIESFVMLIGNVDAELAFQYVGNELNLKKQLVRGKSYTFCVKKLSIYQLLKGVNMNGKKHKAE